MAAAERLICRAESLADGGDGERFTVAHHGVSESAFAVRFGGKVYAYLNRCGHMPVELDWQGNRMKVRGGQEAEHGSCLR